MSTIAKFLDFMKNSFPHDFPRIDKDSIKVGYDHQFHEPYFGFTFILKAEYENTLEGKKKFQADEGREPDNIDIYCAFTDREHFVGYWQDEDGNDMFEW